MSGTCAECGTPFEITADDQKFLDDFAVPAPKSCPECRLTRRMIERNARRLYWRTSDATGKRILSQYHADHPFPVYTPEEWWSDRWDGLTFGRAIDFARPFFQQFLELKNVVPHQARFLIQDTIENSDYVNCAGFLKNCYLSFEVDYNEDCYYSNRVYHCKNMVDCSNCYESEICYESLDCTGCHSVFYSQDCQNCSGSSFLKNCIGCRDCIGCINQRQKQHMILNEQYSKEEFTKHRAALHLDTTDGIRSFLKKAEEFFSGQPRRYAQTERNEHCTGDHLYDSKNAFSCMDCKDLEDCRYCAKVARA
ncbi:MAG: zinc-ribbon domain containing protein [Candidatus Peribacteraceae bacterium]|jgi:hypothetical protein|nr:zinc-ribbon domain containing protein [Candidatus Peribacteraceae bacterium]